LTRNRTRSNIMVITTRPIIAKKNVPRLFMKLEEP
jgi:hypothetical protein